MSKNTDMIIVPDEEERQELYESYLLLVWKRFRKSKAAIVGGLMITMLGILAVFAEFFSPTDLNKTDFKQVNTPPQRIRFIDAEGNFHFRPFVYNKTIELDPTTFAPIWTDDTSRRYPIRFFVRTWEYKFLGLIPSRLHLFGVEHGGTIYLMGTERFGRDLWGRACWAGRISLSMSIFAALISLAIGSVIGVVSGYYGGTVDWALQRMWNFFSHFHNCLFGWQWRPSSRQPGTQ